MSFWQLGNTSVRSALRIREGIIALSKSTIQGNIRNHEGDVAFRELLGECGIVSLGSDVSYSVGRKWRSAMEKLGFIYPKINERMGFKQEELGQLNFITPAGRNLITSDTVPAIQECYLRSMITPITPMVNGKTFSPLRWVLAIILEIENRMAEPFISFPEMATVVITSTPADGLHDTVDRLLDLRQKRNAAKNKRVFDGELYALNAKKMKKRASTFRDYADMNIRYLKATGIVQAKGKGIALVPEKHTLSVLLAKEIESSEPLLSLYQQLCKGSALPTDNKDDAIRVLTDLINSAKQYGIRFSIQGLQQNSTSQINKLRYSLEEEISHRKETQYALEQADKWEEISTYMDMIITQKEKVKINDDIELQIPQAEAPAYLEWCIWRAFLAINHLINEPYNVRRFNIDQDFLPVSTAPGNGPDLIAEFEDRVIVIEVTLSESSRQEAMEGEPVRRHVADIMMRFNKPVYGLFIANRIDNNTAETFRIGRWYTRNDEKLKLIITPLTLHQFSAYFKAMFMKEKAIPQNIFDLLEKCDGYRKVLKHGEGGAPEWKKYIDDQVNIGIKAM